MTTVESPATDPVARVVPRRVQLPKFGVELGPLLHLADERARLASLTFEHITVTPKGVTLGAEVSGVELGGDLPDEVIAEIRRALVEFKVLVFRGQPLTSADHVGFARRFGELEVHPFLMGSAEHPELVRFEKGAESGGFENGWHHDVTWREAPSMGAVLRAVQVPPTGGDTLFADMAAAYDGLDDDTKQQLDGLEAAHDYLMAFGHFVEDEKRPRCERSIRLCTIRLSAPTRSPAASCCS